MLLWRRFFCFFLANDFGKLQTLACDTTTICQQVTRTFADKWQNTNEMFTFRANAIESFRPCERASELNEFIKQREATKFAELCDAMQSTGKKRKVVDEEAKKVSEQAADEGDAAQSKKKNRSARRRERRVEFNSSQGS